MRLTTSKSFNHNQFIKLMNAEWLEKQRIAGKITSEVLTLLQGLVHQGTNQSLLQLNNLAEDYIASHHGTPTFKGYKGFPFGVCMSVNQQIVHGIPTEYYLREGDMVSFDLGVTFEEAIADSALTCIYGKPSNELQVKVKNATQEALYKGIKAIQVGKKLGCIGNAIAKCAKGYSLGNINQYGGHGINWGDVHAQPFVANKASVDEGIRIQAGLSIAIEPQLTSGSTQTWVGEDGWTVYGEAEYSAHFEHSVYVHEDRVEIITLRADEVL